jgi:hypothetical protein
MKRLQVQNGADVWETALSGAGFAIHRNEHHIHTVCCSDAIQMDILPQDPFHLVRTVNGHNRQVHMGEVFVVFKAFPIIFGGK